MARTTTTWNGKPLTATEAADSLATQVIAHARKAAQHQLDQGVARADLKLDGKRIVDEIWSEAAGGYMGEFLQRCTAATTPTTVRTAVKRATR